MGRPRQMSRIKTRRISNSLHRKVRHLRRRCGSHHRSNFSADSVSSVPGSAIADSPADPAVAMRDRVRELVREGYTEGQILDYYATRYGEWILLSPKAEGLNWILWTVPPLLTGIGLSWLLIVVVRWSNEPDDVPLPSDVGDMPIDRYERMLLEELEK